MPAEASGVIWRRLSVGVAVVLAALLLGIGISGAQEGLPDTVACPQVPGYEASNDTESVRSLFSGAWVVDCFYSTTSFDDDGMELESSIWLHVRFMSEITDEDVAA